MLQRQTALNSFAFPPEMTLTQLNTTHIRISFSVSEINKNEKKNLYLYQNTFLNHSSCKYVMNTYQIFYSTH